jgi:hypothetical protein
VIWGTAVGLTLAHAFAFNLAASLYSRDLDRGEATAVVISQVAAAVAVAALLSIPFMLLDLSTALNVDQFLVIAFLGFTGWGVAHTTGRAGLQALTFGAVLLVLGVTVVLVKVALSAH